MYMYNIYIYTCQHTSNKSSYKLEMTHHAVTHRDCSNPTEVR